MTDIFTNDPSLADGDISVIIRENGDVQIAAATAQGLQDPARKMRLVENTLAAAGAHAMLDGSRGRQELMEKGAEQAEMLAQFGGGNAD